VEPVGGSMALWNGRSFTLNFNSLYPKPLTPEDLVEEIGFLTDDAEGLRAYLAAIGFEARDISGSGSPSPHFVVLDPEGHRIEFVQQSLSSAFQISDVSPAQQREIIHVGLVVKDRQAMEHFYKDILGFHLYWHGGMKDGETDWVDMRVPDGTDWIEFMLNVPENADKQTLGIMNHISLGVPDVRAAAKELESKGMKLPEQPEIGRDGKWQLNLYDPDGTRVELMEFTPVEKPCCSDYTGPHPRP